MRRTLVAAGKGEEEQKLDENPVVEEREVGGIGEVG